MKPVVRVVGLGPGDLGYVSLSTWSIVNESPVARLRTRRHPAALSLDHIESYDEWYERAESFESLYLAIVDDLIALARDSPTGEVVYIVPGSPTVAERTVELLGQRDEVRTIREPAVSVIDVACATLGRDPMAGGLRIVDALGTIEPFRGPGPLLVLQTYSREVMATVSDRLPSGAVVKVLYHLGLEDEFIGDVLARDLVGFERVDHLTSLWIEGLRSAGETADDLVDFTRRLRRECPWDQEQTHASLIRHLLEEAYEVLDALDTFVRLDADNALSEAAIAHVEEELGDLLFQIVFHAELGDEEGLFNFATIADSVRDKLIRRHPHVFGDVQVSGADEVAARWERLKMEEKGRVSVTDGVAWQLPALSLYSKLLGKARQVEISTPGDTSVVRRVFEKIEQRESTAPTPEETSEGLEAWGDALSAMVVMATDAGVDLEGVLRQRAIRLRDEIRAVESS